MIQSERLTRRAFLPRSAPLGIFSVSYLSHGNRCGMFQSIQTFLICWWRCKHSGCSRRRPCGHIISPVLYTVTLSALMGFIPHVDTLQSENKPHHFFGSQVFLNYASSETKTIFCSFLKPLTKIYLYFFNYNKVKKEEKWCKICTITFHFEESFTKVCKYKPPRATIT